MSKNLQTKGRTLDYAASVYDSVINIVTIGREKKIRTEAIETLVFDGTDRILDIGCGTGSMTMQIAGMLKSPGKIVGIDAANGMIEVAKKNLDKIGLNEKCEFRYELAEELPFDDGSFDCCFSSMFYHHLPEDLKIKSLSEAFRILKPGGKFFVIDIDKPDNIFTRIFAMSGYIFLMQPAIKENIDGLMPKLISQAGFEGLTLLKKKFGLISSYQAVKPMKN